MELPNKTDPLSRPSHSLGSYGRTRSINSCQTQTKIPDDPPPDHTVQTAEQLESHRLRQVGLGALNAAAMTCFSEAGPRARVKSIQRLVSSSKVMKRTAGPAGAGSLLNHLVDLIGLTLLKGVKLSGRFPGTINGLSGPRLRHL